MDNSKLVKYLSGNDQIDGEDIDKIHESGQDSGMSESGKEEVDWIQVKAEYFSGARPKFLSEKYGIPVETIRSQIKRGGWNKEKKDVNDQVAMIVRDAHSETLAELQIIIREKYRKVFSLVLEPTLEMFRTWNDPKEMFYLSKIIEICMRQEFRCAGITEESDSHLHELINPVPKETTTLSGDLIDKLSVVSANKVLRFFEKLASLDDNDLDKGST